MANPMQTGNYQVFSPYTGSDNGCTNGVFLFPPSFLYNKAITLTIRFIYSGGSNYNQYASQVAAVNNNNVDFQLALVPGQSQGNNAPEVYVQITIQPNNVWMCAQSARQTLMSNFANFITQIEAVCELGSTPFMISGATSIIAGQIAEIMPAPLGETLFYRYGFNSGLAAGTSTSVDLMPGMRLRVEFEATQFVTPGSPFNSYLSNGQLYYYVSSVPGANNQRYLAFDPFLGQIVAPKIQQSGSAPFPASGIIDLESAGMARRYYQLVYPQNMIAGNLPGDSSAAKNITLTGANTLADLNAGTGSSVTSIFRGRAIVVPEIPVWLALAGQQAFAYNVSGSGTAQGGQYNINGTATMTQTGSTTQTMLIYVPLGTTVANILERFTAWRPIYLQQQVISLSRLQTASGSKTGNQSVGYQGVQFLYSVPNTLVGNLQSFDLPLVSGDLVTINF